MAFRRSAFLHRFLSGLALLLLATCVHEQPTESRPKTATVSGSLFNQLTADIVVILTDDQRFDMYDPAIMPLTWGLLNPDAVTFTRGLATTSLCCPSRAGILTGRYSHNTGVLTNGLPNGGATRFDPSSTVATWLQQAGYRTGYVGKYLNDYARLSPAVPPGWDDFQALVSADGAGLYYDYPLNENGIVRTYGSSVQDYSTTVLTDKAVAFINSIPAGQPMLLFFAPSAPHAPATPHPSDIGRFAGFPNWRPPSYNEPNVGDKTRFVRNQPLITTARMATSDDLHRRQMESLQSVDRAVAEIVSALQQTGRWANTLFIFLSDNGLSWGEHRLLDRKSCPYEECGRVPFVVRVPGVAARLDTNLVANIDLAPTIAEWAGVTPPANVNGVSLLGLLGNPATPWRTALLIEQLGFAATHTDYQGVRTARYMYAEYQNGEAELYDLVTDPYQLKSVVKLSSYSSIKNSLRSILATLKNS